MRIAFCICSHAAIGAIPVVELLRSIERQGHEVVLVAFSQNGSIPDEFFVGVLAEQASNDEWWAKQAFDVVFAYSLGFPVPVLRAIKESGSRIILDCDSDGRVSPRLWPRDALRHFLDERHSTLTKFRVLIYWAKRYMWPNKHESNTIALLSRSDLIRIESTAAAKNLQRFLLRRKIERDHGDICAIPFCAPIEAFSEFQILDKKPQMVIAGRLESQQKNPRLLCQATKELVQRIPELTVSVFSRGDCHRFRELAQSMPERISYRCDQPKVDVYRALQESRILLSASRFETLPVVGIEALCAGCTLVATPLDGFQELSDENRYGTIAESFSVRSLVKSFLHEWRRWEKGERRPMEISAAARSRYHPDVVAKQLIDVAKNCLSVNSIGPECYNVGSNA